MLTILKENFESQTCYCCSGLKANYADPNSSVQVVLYHRLPDDKQHLRAKVIIPRCKECAKKMAPVGNILLVTTILAVVFGFVFGMSDSGILYSLFISVVWGVVTLGFLATVLDYAFKFVYRQDESNYEIVQVMKSQYGWQTSEPKQGESDFSFTDTVLNNMLNVLQTQHNCVITDVE